MVRFLLPCSADSVDSVEVVVMGWHCKDALMGVALVVVEVLLQQLTVPVVVLPDPGPGVATGIALSGLVGSFLAWLVVFRYLRSVLRISGGRIPWCCRCGSDCRTIS